MAGVMKPSPGALRIIDDLEGGLAIVCNGNTAPKNISAGQYLFIKNHSTLPTGGYHATAAISSGGTISSSNVAEDPDGISNALNSKIIYEDFEISVSFSAGTIGTRGASIQLQNYGKTGYTPVAITSKAFENSTEFWTDCEIANGQIKFFRGTTEAVDNRFYRCRVLYMKS